MPSSCQRCYHRSQGRDRLEAQAAFAANGLTDDLAARYFVGRDGRLYDLTPEVRSRSLMTGPAIGTEIERHATNLYAYGLSAADVEAIQETMTPEELERMRREGYPNVHGIVRQMRRDVYDVGRLPLRREDLPRGMPDPYDRSTQPAPDPYNPARIGGIRTPSTR